MALAHRGTAAQALTVLDLLAADVPREPNHFSHSDDAHALACLEIAIAHPSLAEPALTRLFDLAGQGASKAIKTSIDDRVLHLLQGSTGPDGAILPILTEAQREVLRAAALQTHVSGSPVTQVLRHELTPDDPASRQAARSACDRILMRTDPTPEVVTMGSHLVTDAYLARLLDEPDRHACIEKLMEVAENSQEAAANRQDALTAATNLVALSTPEMASAIFTRSMPFVTGERDGSAHDEEMTGHSHPLSFLRMSMGIATLRGHGLQLAAVATRDAAERRWVREQAVHLLRSNEDAVVLHAVQALATLPAEFTNDLDANLLAAHPHVNVRQASVHLCLRQPERHRTTLLHLSRDANPRVRSVLANAVARARVAHPEVLAEVIQILATDARHSIRSACRPEPCIE